MVHCFDCAMFHCYSIKLQFMRLETWGNLGKGQVGEARTGGLKEIRKNKSQCLKCAVYQQNLEVHIRVKENAII